MVYLRKKGESLSFTMAGGGYALTVRGLCGSLTKLNLSLGTAKWKSPILGGVENGGLLGWRRNTI
jgi:hypothetical protein